MSDDAGNGCPDLAEAAASFPQVNPRLPCLAGSFPVPERTAWGRALLAPKITLLSGDTGREMLPRPPLSSAKLRAGGGGRTGRPAGGAWPDQPWKQPAKLSTLLETEGLAGAHLLPGSLAWPSLPG